MKDSGRGRLPPAPAGALPRMALHAVAGALLGLLLLHPLSLHVNRAFEGGRIGLVPVVREAFSPVHLPMALYFAFVGALIGLAFGAYSVHLARLYEEVRRLSLTDALTGLHNRRYLMQRLEEEIERCQRYGRSLALIMADLDHFKRYNDRHGHRQGDLLLKEVAAVLRSHVRRPDFVARYGGEEFAVVMPETDLGQATTLAERIRVDLREHAPAERAGSRRDAVTMSFGVASIPADAGDAATVIEEADRALYHAKSSGRDRVVRRVDVPDR